MCNNSKDEREATATCRMREVGLTSRRTRNRKQRGRTRERDARDSNAGGTVTKGGSREKFRRSLSRL